MEVFIVKSMRSVDLWATKCMKNVAQGIRKSLHTNMFFVAGIHDLLRNDVYYVPNRKVTILDIVIMAEPEISRRRWRGECSGAVGASEVTAVESKDSEWETDEEEEQLLQVELSGFFQDDLSKNPNLEAKFIGLDTKQPIVQLGGQVFAGKYTETVGASVFFKATGHDDEVVDDPVFSTKPTESLEYFCQTGRKLTLKRVFLNGRKK